MSQDNELPGSETPGEEDETSLEKFITEETETATVQEANKQLYNRAKTSETTIKELKEAAGVKSLKELRSFITQPKAPQASVSNTSSSPQEVEEKVELRLQGYSPDEIALVKRLAGDQSLMSALQDPTVQAAVSGVRAKKQADNAVPEPTSRAPLYGEKAFGEKNEAEKKGSYSQTIDAGIKRARTGNRSNI